MAAKPDNTDDEPRGLAAHSGALPDALRHAILDSRYRDAIDEIRKARAAAKTGQPEAETAHCRRAMDLLLRVLDGTEGQPDRAIIAECGAQCALRAGQWRLAADFVRKGLPAADARRQWDLARLRVIATALDALYELRGDWQPDWQGNADTDGPDLVVRLGGRALRIVIDEDAIDAVERDTTESRLEIVTPLAPNKAQIRALVFDWIRPRPDLEREYGLVERSMPALAW